MVTLINYLKTYGIVILDVLIVTLIIYNLYKLVAGTRTIPVVKGIVIMVFAYFLGRFLELNTFLWLFQKGLEFSAIALIVIFQDELRHIIMKVGENISMLGKSGNSVKDSVLSLLSKSIYNLSKKSIGALIVLVQKTGLRGIIESGIQIDAKLSKELFESIFLTSSPLHDGAVIIDQNRIASVGCLLPLTRRKDLNKIFGTRHRAAIGLTEETDAVVIVVSEENSKISIAHAGELSYMTEEKEFEDMLENLISKNISKNKENYWTKFRKLFKKNKNEFNSKSNQKNKNKINKSLSKMEKK